MSVDIPANIEHDIQQFAQEEHLTHEEAVPRLIEAGLSMRKAGKPVPKTVFEQALGLFGAPEDASLLDEVVWPLAPGP